MFAHGGYLVINQSIAERDKEYRQVNKVKLAEYNREYNQADKGKRKEKVTCECGCILAKGALIKHKKTNKHLKLMQSK